MFVLQSYNYIVHGLVVWWWNTTLICVTQRLEQYQERYPQLPPCLLEHKAFIGPPMSIMFECKGGGS